MRHSLLRVFTVALLFLLLPAVVSAQNLLSVQSRKIHSTAGQFDLSIAPNMPITGSVTVEPRSVGGTHSFAFLFDTAIVSFGAVSAVDANGTAIGTASATFSGSELTVSLTGIPDNIRVTIRVTGVNGVKDVATSVGFLVGDMTSKGYVTQSDLSAVRARSGQLTTGSNYWLDVNASGAISAADIAAVKGRLGFSIPLSPAGISVAFAGTGGGRVISNPAGLACNSACTRSFNLGASIVLTAIPSSDSAFTGWSGACSGASVNTTLTVSNGISCTATFTQLPQVSVTVVIAGNGSGSISSTPSRIDCSPTCTANFVQNSVVSLTATPALNSVFVGWTGACGGNAATANIALANNITCTATFAPIVPSGPHPRIWLGEPTTMARLTAAAMSNSPEWLRLRNFCNNSTLPTFQYQGDQQFRYVANFALCYRITLAVSGSAAAAPYAQKAINVLQGTAFPLLNFTAFSTDSGYGIRNYVPALALAFDWLYDSPLMTTSLKSAIVGRIQDWMTFYAASGYAAVQPISNYNSGYVLGGVLAAIAVYGESPQANVLWTTGLMLFNAGRQAFDEKMAGGHWVEGWNYGTGVYERYLQAASAMKSATGDPSYLASTWLTNNVTFKVNALSPNNRFFYDDGLWSGDLRGDPRINDMVTAGFTFGWGTTNGQIARAYYDKVSSTGVPLTSMIEWNAFLYFDPASLPYNLSQLPASFHAVGTGLVVMRADWADPAATWGTVMAGGPYTSFQSEQDKDQGHIEIYKSAPLLIDAGHGLYGDAGIKNTRHHNSYTFENRTDNTSRSYEGQLSVTGACPNPLGTPGNPNPAGSGNNPIGVNAHIDGGGYVFTSGEFSAAYQSYEIFPSQCGSLPVSWMNRNVLYLRPNVFVVYDQVQKISNQPQVVPKMHLHFPTQPFPIAPDNRQMSLDNGAARLQVATVLPAANTSTIQFETVNTTIGPGISNWHLSVRYADSSPMYQKFLTVLRAGTSAPSNTFPTIGAVSGTNVSGTLITGLPIQESDKPIAVVFADNGTRTIPTSIQYQYGSSLVTNHYVAKLKPNAFYVLTSTIVGLVTTVTVTESTSGTKTDAAGLLVFTL